MNLPAEYVVGMDSILVTAVVGLGVALSRTRERLARLEGKVDYSQSQPAERLPILIEADDEGRAEGFGQEEQP